MLIGLIVGSWRLKRGGSFDLGGVLEGGSTNSTPPNYF